jgi:hypothetical protein
MNLTRIPIVDAQPGMVASIDGDTATVTKVRRRRGSDYLSVTFVDDLGSVFARRYYDGDDGSPTNWTLDILT